MLRRTLPAVVRSSLKITMGEAPVIIRKGAMEHFMVEVSASLSVVSQNGPGFRRTRPPPSSAPTSSCLQGNAKEGDLTLSPVEGSLGVHCEICQQHLQTYLHGGLNARQRCCRVPLKTWG